MADIMSPETRSRLMSRIKCSNTGPERLLSSLMHRQGLRYRRHFKELPGKPDFVFPKYRAVVFVDGDFWHGWQFDVWQAKLTPFWKNKLQGNIDRDRRNEAALEQLGWKYLRIWEHEVEEQPQQCLERVIRFLHPTVEAEPFPQEEGTSITNENLLQ